MSPRRLASCPCCNKKRDVDEQQGLRAVEAVWFKWDAARCNNNPCHPFYPLLDGMRQLAVEHHEGSWFWACDACLKEKRAIAADVTKVTIGMGTPFAAYVDRPFRCEDCGAESVFSAKEQRYWFETIKFLIGVYPKQCAPCRAKRRRRKGASRALADALRRLDPKDPEQLDAIAELYEQIGSPGKAGEFRARARNRRSSP
jgi:hypothetical protein